MWMVESGYGQFGNATPPNMSIGGRTELLPYRVYDDDDNDDNGAGADEAVSDADDGVSTPTFDVLASISQKNVCCI
jgi:hypothetical protein